MAMRLRSRQAAAGTHFSGWGSHANAVQKAPTAHLAIEQPAFACLFARGHHFIKEGNPFEQGIAFDKGFF
jgi:hypothetical protein